MSLTQRQSLQDGDRAIETIAKLQKNRVGDTRVGHSYINLVRPKVGFPTKEFGKFTRNFGDQCTYYFGVAAIVSPNLLCTYPCNPDISQASFFALVQIALVPIIGNPDCDSGTDVPSTGCDSHSRLIRAIINFFSYLALSLDALGAFSALLTVQKLAQVSQNVQKLLDNKKGVEEATLEELESPPPHSDFFRDQKLCSRIHQLSSDADDQRDNMPKDRCQICCHPICWERHVSLSR
ncbi:hypothetical protein B0H16DRAFT_1736521 [Mycena metata]|uniref:Uncharacterized protein n=1 Tax=Mycena metata TaxID=1033252 RepID=A0AAD7MMR9_9AGAR|nr:hypothetical protein B0H16DRAFT_1736521 [Mycena metata]